MGGQTVNGHDLLKLLQQMTAEQLDHDVLVQDRESVCYDVRPRIKFAFVADGHVDDDKDANSMILVAD